MLFRPSWAVLSSWSGIETVPYCPDSDLFVTCLISILDVLLLEVAVGSSNSRGPSGSANLDFYDVSFKSYANTARPPHADPSRGYHGFDCARANESRYNCQAPRRTTCLHW